MSHGVFESAMPMINAYNKAISEKANDVDYFADAYMKVMGKRLEQEDVATIRDDRVINMWSDDPDLAGNLNAEFMTRPSGDTSQENLVNRLERLIFKISMVSDISDESFGNASGVSLRYKLECMSNMAKAKERKFTAAMNRRYRLIFSNPIVRTAGISEDAWMTVRYHFTLNYPANIADEAATARNLEGIVSKETQLKVLSIVDDARAEIDRINAETAAVMKDIYGDRGGMDEGEAVDN